MWLVYVILSAFLSLLYLHVCVCGIYMCKFACVGKWGGGGVDGLSGSSSPQGEALVNISDEAHYQGSGDFSPIPL